MFGFDPLTGSALLILAAGSPADMCGTQRSPTKLNIVPRTASVVYDYSQSLKKIQSYATDTVDPYAYHGTTVTQGFMKGSIETKYTIKFKSLEIPKYKAACLFYDEIKVELNIEPTIVIAKELTRDRCLKKAIIEHELKHVRVDREIVNKYAKLVGKKLLADLKSRGFMAGPFPSDRTGEISNKMKQVVSQILELEFQKMTLERKENQRAVDNLEEYESVNAKCPAFEENKEKLYIQWLK